MTDNQSWQCGGCNTWYAPSVKECHCGIYRCCKHNLKIEHFDDYRGNPLPSKVTCNKCRLCLIINSYIIDRSREKYE